jgi:hypothetical protein
MKNKNIQIFFIVTAFCTTTVFGTGADTALAVPGAPRVTIRKVANLALAAAPLLLPVLRSALKKSFSRGCNKALAPAAGFLPTVSKAG